MADFPNIDYEYWYKNYSWDGFSSIRGMITTMINKGYIESDVKEKNITDKIRYNIIVYNKTPNDDLLFQIFKLIQTWGGKSAGRHTLNIIENWNENTIFKYRTFVQMITNKQIIESFNYLIKKEKIKGLSYSFVPKHICFWSGNGDRTNGYPILDDVIAKLVYNKRSARSVIYQDFIRDISSFAKTKQLTMAQVEMALFAFAGYFWKTQKTGTDEFRINDIQNHKDFEEALKLSNR